MTIQEIKSNLHIQAVLNHFQLTPDRNNRLKCPWHNDKTPSLQIYPDTNTWTCFSSNCDAGSGDQIDFIMKYEQITKHEAIQKSKVLLGREIIKDKEEQNGLDYKSIFRRLKTNYTKSKRAREYAANRMLRDVELGYNVTSWPQLKHCLIFPLRNKDNTIVSFYGRSIVGTSANTHYYLKNRTGLYPHYPKSNTTKLILTESIIDAASLLSQTAIKEEYEILASYGTNGLTDAHIEAINSLKLLQDIVLFFDGDEAGKAAIQKYSKQLKELKPDAKISYVDTPDEEDVNSLLISHEPRILKHLIDSRLSFSIEKSTEKEKHSQLNTTNSELLIYNSQNLHITILGGIKITGLDRLRVTLKIEYREPTTANRLPIRYALDLYHAKQVDHLCEMIASQLEIRSSKAHQIISELTTALEEYRQRRLESMKPKKPQIHEMTPEDKQAAMKYLKDELLMVKTAQDIKASGIVGEEKNAMIGYITYLSRKRAKPLHVMYLGASGSGKTHLQEGLAHLVPTEDKIEATGLSDQALYYEGMKLKGKILFIEDISGAENIMYIIRELQSKGKIVKRVAWRDNKGNTQTIEVVAEGPVVISSCTTQEKVYEDNANRCILLYIDQSKEQDKRVMDYIKNKSTGQIKESEQQQIRTQIQNVQRLLRPIKVYNPYANLIDLPSEVFKPRRSLPLLLGFIETVTFYHQHQRSVSTDRQTGERFISSTYEDIQISFDLLKNVLFSKSDELSKAAREFLERLKSKIKKGDTFYTKKIRKEIRMNASNLKRYMIELQRYDYIKIKGGSRYRGYEYEITDYGEYENLKSSIDSRLEQILSKIKAQNK